jgi:probable phosphoglycerate mutase
VHVHNALDEMDFGEWTGLCFAELENDPKWHAWNVNRARTRPPGGETMVEARARVLRHVERTAARYPSGTIAMFTHAEIIRAIKLHQAGLSPNAWQTVDVPLGSVTTLEIPPTSVPQSVFEAAAS